MRDNAMHDFSVIDGAMQRFEQRAEVAAIFSPATPWEGKDATPKAAKARRAKAAAGFWEFDEMYFPPEMYGEGFSPANEFHRAITDACELGEKRVTVLLGPNGHAKSATLYKWDIWAALYGKAHFVCYAGQTLDTPRAIIIAIQSYLSENARIKHDFPDLEFVRASSEFLHVRTKDNPKGTVFFPLSAERSPRGKVVNLTERPDRMHVEDLENRASSMTSDAVKKRRDLVEEMRNAMAPNGCMTITANNFDERCLANQYKTEYEAGELDAKFTVESFPAWGKYRQRNGRYSLRRGTVMGPLWPERFPAKSEDELRTLMGTSSDEDWQGGQQQQPIKPQGDYFKRASEVSYIDLPSDCVGVTYCDPNLAIKGKVDRTCLGALLYSATTGLLYAAPRRYRSYANSNDLIDDMVETWRWMVKLGIPIVGAAMDGNVNQESHWTNHIANYVAQRNVLLPVIDYRRYHVEQIAKLAQAYWSRRKIAVPEVFIVPEERRPWTEDIYAFTGRKLQGRKDDAPDWLICAVQYITELGFSLDTVPGPPARSNHHSRLAARPRLGKL